MPTARIIKKAQESKREGKSPSTQAGHFVKEEMDHIKTGKHGAKNREQAIAIGLSKARQSGVDIPSSLNSKKKSKTTTHSKRIVRPKVSHKRSHAALERLR